MMERRVKVARSSAPALRRIFAQRAKEQTNMLQELSVDSLRKIGKDVDYIEKLRMLLDLNEGGRYDSTR